MKRESIVPALPGAASSTMLGASDDGRDPTDSDVRRNSIVNQNRARRLNQRRREADRTNQADAVDLMWNLVHRCRACGFKVHVQPGAHETLRKSLLDG